MKKVSPQGISETVATGDLYYSRMIVLPGTSDLYIIGGSKDMDSDITVPTVNLLRGKSEIISRKPMNVPRSKVSLSVGRCTDTVAGRTYIFSVGG